MLRRVPNGSAHAGLDQSSASGCVQRRLYCVVGQARTYGVLSWPILYQAEVRVELAERVRREGHYQATTSDRPI
eukprot:6318961-Amphidinium_carterae.1